MYTNTKNKPKIIFMGTPEFAIPCLDYLFINDFNILSVITQPDRPKGRGGVLQASPVKEYAIKKGINVLQPEKINRTEVLEEIRLMKPDLFITVAFGQMLSKELLDIPSIGCINVHGSLLPKYRGAAPMQWALINGEKETGITTMFTDVGMDTGDMLLSDILLIHENMNFKELHDEMSLLGVKTLKRTLDELDKGTLKRQKQNNSDASYAPLKPLQKKEICKLDWNKSSFEIHNLIRALDPYPGAYTYYQGKRIKIFRSRYIGCELNTHVPGEIVDIGQCKVSVATGDGLINIYDIQFQDCRKMCIEECGHNLALGEIFGKE